MLKRSLVLLTMIAVFTAGCSNSKSKGQQAMPPSVVVVAPASVEAVGRTDSFVGTVDAVGKASISTRVGGFLSKILVNEGDYVKKDQPLFIIEKDQYQAAVSQARASLAQAEANERNVRMQKERAEALLKSAGISQAKYDDTVTAYSSAKAGVLQAKAALDLAELNLNYTTITSPVEGKVGFISFKTGETVSPASGILTTVISPDPMNVVFSVSDKQLQQIRTTYKMTEMTSNSINSAIELHLVTSDGTVYPFPGAINFVDNTVTGTTDSIRMRGIFSNPGGILIPGQTVTVQLVSKEKSNQIVIPLSAVQNDLAGKFVTVAKKIPADPEDKSPFTGKMAVGERRNLTVGSELPGNKQVIFGGLNEGDMIIVEGIQKIRPGTPFAAFTASEYQSFMEQMAKQQQENANGKSSGKGEGGSK